jgi:cell fate regulator YaaT (PSP1 superfamily)
MHVTFAAGRQAPYIMSIAGIRLRHCGPTLYCDSMPIPPVVGERLMVETEHGLLLGQLVSLHASLPDGSICSGITVLRAATDADMAAAKANEELARRARRFCQDSIRYRKLDMKLVDVEVYFDASKIIFYFTAPARIDFRELLKDLVREYRARIELRQIGVRHETQMIGAVGNCGMVCCCRRFLRKFAPVTIRMAKEQNLFLNPAKISGICGRLLCCLSYEQENYDAFHRECPRLGKKYQTTQGSMKVLRANMFRNSLSVLNEANEEQELTLEAWRALMPRRPEQTQQAEPERQENPRSDPGGFLVVSVSPESLNDPELFSELIENAFEGEAPVKQTAAAAQKASEKKSKRKRRPRQT